MLRIEWNDDYKLGLPAMDADHQELVEICNQFLAAARADAPIPLLSGLLDQLVVRTRLHFLHEERMLDRHNYPGLAVHKADHQRLLAQADTLRQRFDSAVEEEEIRRLTTDTADFLRFWLLEHITTNDRPYRPFLRSLS